MYKGKVRVRDIIRPQMTILRFLYSSAFSEFYFQSVCQSAIGMVHFDRREIHHPYSFGKMKAVLDGSLKRGVDNGNDSPPKKSVQT